ncbi:MAG: L-seryl-tRNA(Sec) selenium transferase [Blastocatellia bacterium]|nr:L-seryl-tRNA(Sec) selenium transferase [Blastocatellia bacterium]
MHNDLSAQEAVREIPSIDLVINDSRIAAAASEHGRDAVAGCARIAVEHLRTRVIDGNLKADRTSLLSSAVAEVLEILYRADFKMVQHVINATGVVIHTNLGRAPLSAAAAEASARAGRNYVNVELDIATGGRGKRGHYAEELLCELTGAESAAIVNNCAAAAFLVLAVHAAGGEVIISRGELVEIGGDFRVPDVLARSGAHLREVGTTNRTKTADYERAIGDQTKMLLRVHPSNYKIIGFTESPANRQLAEIANTNGLIFYEDAGSGALVDLSAYGLQDEPLIRRSIEDGAHIVTFSGDKLLGGPQAGLIVGDKELIETIRRHPLYRALRAGKMVYAALGETLRAYHRGTHFEEIPVLRMLAAGSAELQQRADDFVRILGDRLQSGSHLMVNRITGSSAIGGGSAPGVQPEAALIALTSDVLHADEIKHRLRCNKPPIVARIEDDAVLIDLRTVTRDEEDSLAEAVFRLVDSSGSVERNRA